MNRKAPNSIRLGDEREGRLHAFKDREGIRFSDAIHRLLDAGLAMAGFPSPHEAQGNGKRPIPAQPAARKPATDGVQIGPVAQPPGSRLKAPPKAKERWRL